jgi:hypothetical protein
MTYAIAAIVPILSKNERQRTKKEEGRLMEGERG